MTAHGINAQHEPLFQAKIVRSFAHRSDQQRLPSDEAAPASAGPSTSTGQAMDMPGNDNSTGTAAALSSMLSFKEISVDLAPVDLTAHEAFLTSLFSFTMQLPLDDIWQVRPRPLHMPTPCHHTARPLHLRFGVLVGRGVAEAEQSRDDEHGGEPRRTAVAAGGRSRAA